MLFLPTSRIKFIYKNHFANFFQYTFYYSLTILMQYTCQQNMTRMWFFLLVLTIFSWHFKFWIQQSCVCVVNHVWETKLIVWISFSRALANALQFSWETQIFTRRIFWAFSKGILCICCSFQLEILKKIKVYEHKVFETSFPKKKNIIPTQSFCRIEDGKCQFIPIPREDLIAQMMVNTKNEENFVLDIYCMCMHLLI